MNLPLLSYYVMQAIQLSQMLAMMYLHKYQECVVIANVFTFGVSLYLFHTNTKRKDHGPDN